jgi:regulator of PEP synthase PpsR (kinase-PPPase family)
VHRKIKDDSVKLKEKIFIEGVKKDAIIDFKIEKDNNYAPITVRFDASNSTVKDENIVKSIFEKIENHKGIVIYNISNKKIRKHLKEFCVKNQVPYVSLVGTMVEEIAD